MVFSIFSIWTRKWCEAKLHTQGVSSKTKDVHLVNSQLSKEDAVACGVAE